MCSRDLLEYLARNSSGSQGEKRDKGDSVAFTVIHHIVPLTIGKAVPVLHGNNRNDAARALDMLLRDVRQTNQPDLSLIFEFCQRAHRILERHYWIRNVQLI